MSEEELGEIELALPTSHSDVGQNDKRRSAEDPLNNV